jgi:response regulator of citrate/malate metabolism
MQASAQTEATHVDAEIAQADADLASELIASGATTQPAETVIAVLEAHRNGASTNAAAKASGINYRTAQRIVEGAAERRHRKLLAVG